MTFKSPSSGEPVALSYLIPETQDDLMRRRKALEIVAHKSFGMLVRTPDYVNIQVTAARQMGEVYGENDSRFSDNIIAYYEYIRENDVPYNDLHDNGYPSIGCTNCTRAILAGEDPRAGRWSGSGKIESGIHVAGDEAIQGATR